MKWLLSIIIVLACMGCRKEPEPAYVVDPNRWEDLEKEWTESQRAYSEGMAEIYEIRNKYHQEQIDKHIVYENDESVLLLIPKDRLDYVEILDPIDIASIDSFYSGSMDFTDIYDGVNKAITGE